MSATGHTLSPEENAELLRVSARIGPEVAGEDQKGWNEVKRDLALALTRSLLLLAVRDGATECRPGPDGGVVMAFTDDEAAQAWVDEQHPAAPPCGFSLAFGERASSESEGKQRWLELLERAGASALAVNPSGPGGFLLYSVEIGRTRPRLLGRGTRQRDTPWLDADARGPERARSRELRASLERELAHGVPEDQQGHPNPLGSLLSAAEVQYLSARVRLARGETKLGVYQMLRSAFGWGRFGDPYRCIDATLEAAGRLEELGAADPENNPWIAPALDDVRTLVTGVRIGYREDEAVRYRAG